MTSLKFAGPRKMARTGARPCPGGKRAPKLTREQQPQCELVLADACDRMTPRVWSDHPAYKSCSALTTDNFMELSGEFHRHQQYGLEARKWTVRPLTDQEK
jgi:hypothetical protein